MVASMSDRKIDRKKDAKWEITMKKIIGEMTLM